MILFRSLTSIVASTLAGYRLFHLLLRFFFSSFINVGLAAQGFDPDSGTSVGKYVVSYPFLMRYNRVDSK